MADTKQLVGILGAGTMGAGIAQVAASAGWTVELMDVDEDTVRASIEGITKRLDRLVEKGRMIAEERDAVASRLLVATTQECFGDCELVIEAIVENIDVKADRIDVKTLNQYAGQLAVSIGLASRVRRW